MSVVAVKGVTSGSLTVLHRHALYDDYRVTEGCWVECKSTAVGREGRLCEDYGGVDW